MKGRKISWRVRKKKKRRRRRRKKVTSRSTEELVLKNEEHFMLPICFPKMAEKINSFSIFEIFIP